MVQPDNAGIVNMVRQRGVLGCSRYPPVEQAEIVKVDVCRLDRPVHIFRKK